jgi:hypothetical protein
MQAIWSPHDDEICIKAEASGMTINVQTGEPLTFDQLDQLALEYDKVRNNTSIDEFFKKYLTTKPFEF